LAAVSAAAAAASAAAALAPSLAASAAAAAVTFASKVLNSASAAAAPGALAASRPSAVSASSASLEGLGVARLGRCGFGRRSDAEAVRELLGGGEIRARANHRGQCRFPGGGRVAAAPSAASARPLAPTRIWRMRPAAWRSSRRRHGRREPVSATSAAARSLACAARASARATPDASLRRRGLQCTDGGFDLERVGAGKGIRIGHLLVERIGARLEHRTGAHLGNRGDGAARWVS
jgi:hypothetical protein